MKRTIKKIMETFLDGNTNVWGWATLDVTRSYAETAGTACLAPMTKKDSKENGMHRNSSFRSSHNGLALA